MAQPDFSNGGGTIRDFKATLRLAADRAAAAAAAFNSPQHILHCLPHNFSFSYTILPLGSFNRLNGCNNNNNIGGARTATGCSDGAEQ